MDLLRSFAKAPKPLWFRLILRRIVLAVLPKTIRFEGYDLVVNREDHIMGSALLRGHYEPYGTKLFLETVKPGMIVVDCGANIGIYTCLASGAAGSKGKIYSFEPEPRNFKCLTETILLNGLENVQPEALALSDRDEETNLFLSDINMGDHRLGGSDEKRKAVRISARTLDSYWGRNVPEVDVIKLDVQGAEERVLKGMHRTVLSSPNLKIFMEFWPYGLLRGGTTPRALLESLKSYGFSIRSIDQEGAKTVLIQDISDLLESEREEYSFDLLLERNAL